MSQLDKIVEYHLSRLKNSSNKPDIQLEILRELMLLGAQAEGAIPALRELFETSDNPTVKEAAQRIGKHIFVAAKKAQGE